MISTTCLIGHLVSGSATAAVGLAVGRPVGAAEALVRAAALLVAPPVAEHDAASARTSRRVDLAEPVLIGAESMSPGSPLGHPMCDHVGPSTEGARVGREEDLPLLDRRDPGGG